MRRQGRYDTVGSTQTECIRRLLWRVWTAKRNGLSERHVAPSSANLTIHVVSYACWSTGTCCGHRFCFWPLFAGPNRDRTIVTAEKTT